jgi:NAD(P) transhydrogenase subunit beta
VLIAATSYFVAATLFLLGLQRMASPVTARSGIQWAGVGMVIATGGHVPAAGLHNLALIVVRSCIAPSSRGCGGKRVAITDMHRWVALFNGMGRWLGGRRSVRVELLEARAVRRDAQSLDAHVTLAVVGAARIGAGVR